MFFSILAGVGLTDGSLADYFAARAAAPECPAPNDTPEKLAELAERIGCPLTPPPADPRPLAVSIVENQLGAVAMQFTFEDTGEVRRLVLTREMRTSLINRLIDAHGNAEDLAAAARNN